MKGDIYKGLHAEVTCYLVNLMNYTKIKALQDINWSQLCHGECRFSFYFQREVQSKDWYKGISLPFNFHHIFLLIIFLMKTSTVFGGQRRMLIR